MASGKVRDTDKGFDAFFKGLKAVGKNRVKVGIQGREAAQVRPGGSTMVEIAAHHEFGAPNANIPQRSFIRSVADENRREYDNRTEAIVRKLVASPKTTSVKGELLKLGEQVRRDVLAKIDSNIPPALKQATIDRKGGDNLALVDTGLMRASVSVVVV